MGGFEIKAADARLYFIKGFLTDTQALRGLNWIKQFMVIADQSKGWRTTVLFRLNPIHTAAVAF